jgi:hypothetical protein
VADLVYDPDQHYQEVRRKWFDISITHGDGKQEKLETPSGPPPPTAKKAAPKRP